MDSRLFAFKVARPAEAADSLPLEFTYDPQSQTAIWSGGASALASRHCTSSAHHGVWQYCNAYGNYCATSGLYGSSVWNCD